MAFIEISQIAKTFVTAGGSSLEVLADVSLSVERGEFVSILGTMGCGKSTLLKIVAGLMEPDAGRVTIGGEASRGVRPNAAIVFQNYSLLPWFSALENVRLAVGAAREAAPARCPPSRKRRPRSRRRSAARPAVRGHAPACCNRPCVRDRTRA